MPTRLRTSARSRPLRMATGHTVGDEFQRLGGAVDEPGRTGIRDDGGQRSVVVQEQHRLSCAGDADQLTVGRQRIREFRDPLVTRANGDVGQVGEHDVGTAGAPSRRHVRCRRCR